MISAELAKDLSERKATTDLQKLFFDIVSACEKGKTSITIDTFANLTAISALR